jgi:hypothetical protein
MTHTNLRIESRTCIKCGEVKDIPQRHKYANNTCVDCQRIASREYQRLEAIRKGQRVGMIGRKPYPGGFEVTARNKFYGLKAELEKCKSREEWLPLIIRNLNTALNDKEIMEWIKTEKEDEDKPKKQTKIKTDYPDTRGMTWEEWDKLGFGTEGDD